MRRRGVGLLLLLALVFACRRSEPVGPSDEASSPGPTPIVAAVDAPGHAEVEPTWTPEPEHAAATPVPGSAVIEVPVRASPTPIDVGAIPNFDRPRDPTPSSRAEELARCLTYRASLDPTFSSTSRVRLKITATSTCSFWVPAEESGFEVLSKPVAGGGMAAREVGQFQSAIPPRSSHTETIIEIDCPAPAGGCRYEARVWSPSGGGRGSE